MFSKSVACIIFYDTRVSSSTCEIKQKPYKYINIEPPSKPIVNVTYVGLTDEIHVNKEDYNKVLDNINTTE